MENMEKIIEKIKNLFDLSNNNPNEHEAMSAALKAQELMAKYNINMVQLEDSSEKEEITTACVNVNDIKGSNGTTKWRFELARVVSNNFRCDLCFSNRGDVYFIGYKSDAEIASRTFKYLFEVGNKLSLRFCTKVRNAGLNTNGVRYAYQIGFVRGVRDKLERQSHELMIVTPQEVHNKFSDMMSGCGAKPKDIRTVVNTTYECNGAYNRGREDGQNTVDGTRLEDKNAI